MSSPQVLAPISRQALAKAFTDPQAMLQMEEYLRQVGQVTPGALSSILSAALLTLNPADIATFANARQLQGGTGVSVDVSTAAVAKIVVNVLTALGAGVVPIANGGTNAATASGARTSLGLAIGTDVQAHAANLDAIAGLVSAVDQLAYFTGSGTAALATLTSFARTLTAAASASAARLLLGVTATGADTAYAFRANNLSDLANAATARGNLGLTNRARITPANPTGTASAVAVMMGLGSSVSFAPVNSGSVMVIVRGTASNTVSGDGLQAQFAFGTGAAPANGAAATGTAVGVTARATVAAAGQLIPFSLTDVLSLPVGSTYWIDLQVKALTGGTASASDLLFALQELP